MHEAGRRSRVKIGAVIAVAAAAAFGLWLGLRPVDTNELQSSSGADLAHAGAAPSFRLPRIGGNGRMSSEDLAGSPYVLNFWATWCGPCRTEMPAFEKVWQRYKARGVVIVGVNINDDPEEAEDFARKLGVTYPLVVDHNDELATKLGVKGLPQTFFVDSNGDIVGSGATLGLVTEDELTKTIERILRGEA